MKNHRSTSAARWSSVLLLSLATALLGAACGDETESDGEGGAGDECYPTGIACGPSGFSNSACCSEYCGENGTCETL